MVENFRPGVMARFGLDFANVSAANPRVVYCTITGFGSGGGAQLAGYDLLVQALGGLMSDHRSTRTASPTKVGVALVDVLTGSTRSAASCSACGRATPRAAAQHVEVDLLSTLLSGLVNQSGATLATGVSPARLGNAHPSIAPYEVFRAADRELVIAVGNDRQFAALAVSARLDGLAADPRFARNPDRVAHRPELRALIEGALARRHRGRLGERASAAAGVAAGLVNTIREAFDFAASLGLEPVDRTAGPTVARRCARSRTPSA